MATVINKEKKINAPTTDKPAKVPVIMQMETLECGAASLCMVLAYYGKWIPLEKMRIDCGVSRDGSNAKNLLLAARSHGLKAKGYRFDPKTLKQKGTFPCIIHWNFNHFVVLCGFKGDKVYLNDPSCGSVTVDEKTFDESFTGITLMFEPGEGFEPGGSRKSVISFAAEKLKGAKAAMAIVVLSTLVAALISIIRPAFSRIFLDRLLTGKNPEWFMPFIIALACLTVIQILVQCVEAVYYNKIDGKMSTIGNTTYLWKVLHLPLEFFSQRMAGDIQQRQNSNATIASSLVNTFAPLVLQAIMMVFYLVVMLRYSVTLTLIGMADIFMSLIISRIISEERVNITRVRMRDEGKLAGTTVSGIEMVETIKASGAENGFFSRWAGFQASVNAQTTKDERHELYLGMIPAIFSALCNTAILVLGVYYTMQGNFTVGMIMTFQGFVSSFSAPASQLIEAGQKLLETRTDMERIDDVMQYPDDPAAMTAGINTGSYSKLSGNIEIKNITFGYSPLAEPVIKDFSMTLKPGHSVAFVGPSGCGKSTISKLVSGLYKPWEGEILFDGKPLSDIDRDVFKGSLAVVDQNIILFEDTIANNIKMWDTSIEDFEMILAARDAHIHTAIMQREGGYDYKITEGGKDFSGGQRQRMEIARALCQDPTIVILDEATSALDSVTEHEVVKSIKDRGITCIVIAHRLSTIRDCDEIIVLDHGVIAERGTHDELYKKGGMYKELVSND